MHVQKFLFVPRPRKDAHPGSGLAQSLLRIRPGFAQAGSPLLTLITIFGGRGAICRMTSTLGQGDLGLVSN